MGYGAALLRLRMIMMGRLMEPDPAEAMDAEEAADWAWARAYALRAPEWSEAKWRRMNAILGLKVADGDSSGPDRPRTP